MDLPVRKRTRLKGYDYSRNGCYYVTVCTFNREKILGEIVNGRVLLSEYGKIADYVWKDLENHNSIVLHEYIIMPDHIHGIIQLCDSKNDISEIVRQFKTFASRRINEYQRQSGNEPFENGKLWQRSFFDHVIRNEEDYKVKTKYIIENPINND